jgi:hypothetical protein
MTHPSDRESVGERFFVECPNCGAESGSHSSIMTHAGRQCSCGCVFRIDIENESAGTVINEP